MIKLIVFDLMKTLGFRNVSYSITDELKKMSHSKVDRDKFIKIVEKSLELKKWKSKKAAYKNLCISIGLKPTEKNIKLLMNIKDSADSKIKYYDFTIPLLRKLKKLGYKVSMLSNNNVFQAEYMKKYSMLKYFDYVLFSCQIGVLKPHPKIFKKMLKIARCKPEEMLMIGDSLKDDVIPSKKLGINSIQFKNISQLKKELKSFCIKI